jgi:hypothetical protein
MTIWDSRLILHFIVAIGFFVVAYLFWKIKDGQVRIRLIQKNLILGVVFLVASIRGALDILGANYVLYGNALVTLFDFALIFVLGSLIKYLLIDNQNKEKK